MIVGLGRCDGDCDEKTWALIEEARRPLDALVIPALARRDFLSDIGRDGSES